MDLAVITAQQVAELFILICSISFNVVNDESIGFFSFGSHPSSTQFICELNLYIRPAFCRQNPAIQCVLILQLVISGHIHVLCIGAKLYIDHNVLFQCITIFTASHLCDAILFIDFFL